MAISRTVKAAVLALAVCKIGGVTSAAETCNDQCLRKVIDQYLSAMEAHNPGAAPLAPDVRVTLNGAAVGSGADLWAAASSLGLRRYAFDPETANAVVQLSLKNAGVPAVALIRVKVHGGRVTEVETVLAQKNKIAQGVLFDDAAFQASVQADWSSVTPMSERLSRGELINVAATYLAGLKSVGQPGFQVPMFSGDCNRFENGKQVTNANVFDRPPMSCSEQFVAMSKSMEGKPGIGITDERFVVADLKRNIVVSYAIMLPPGAQSATAQTPANGFLIGDMFKIVNGKIKLVQITYDRAHASNGTGW